MHSIIHYNFWGKNKEKANYVRKNGDWKCYYCIHSSLYLDGMAVYPGFPVFIMLEEGEENEDILYFKKLNKLRIDLTT